MNAFFLSFKKCLIYLFLIFISFSVVYADDWTIAAQQFDFTQKTGHSSTDESVSVLIPQLVLEQLSTGSVRLTTEEEMLDRQLKKLQTERLSLYLQLSKEVKVRDSLVLTEQTSYDVKKSIINEEKKISEIHKKIDENLENARKAEQQTQEKIDERNGIKDKLNFFEYLKGFLFEQKNYVEDTTIENVVLYKNSVAELFVPSESSLESGYNSYEYESAVNKEKINGLLTGSITILDQYIAVSAELRIFPGNKTIATVTEIGTIADCIEIAHNIAYSLIPIITNALPVDININIEPENAVSNAKLFIDGVIYNNITSTISINSGIHTIEIESPEYDSVSINYDFSNSPRFDISVPMKKSSLSKVNLEIRSKNPGLLYSNGEFLGNINEKNNDLCVVVKGNPIIGQLIINQDVENESVSSFFYIPEKLQTDNNNLSVKLQPKDISNEIDVRRRWMYAGYSGLILSLPVTFYILGEANKRISSYNLSVNNGDVSYISREEAKRWQTMTYVSEGVSAAAGVFFVTELVRYLYTASQVLPKNVKKVSAKKTKNSIKTELSTTDVIIDSSDELNQKNKVGE